MPEYFPKDIEDLRVLDVWDTIILWKSPLHKPRSTKPMSIHAKISEEAQARLAAQKRNSTISSVIVSDPNDRPCRPGSWGRAVAEYCQGVTNDCDLYRHGPNGRYS